MSEGVITIQPIIMLRLVLGAGVISGSGWMTRILAAILKKTSAPSRIKRISWLNLNSLEWLATIQLLLIAVVALPLLPNQAIGPWNAVNPRTVGYLILFIAWISFLGYFAMRLFGSRGLLATSAIGGLVSSTAVTLSFAKRARKDRRNVMILGAGISLAAAIMAVRVLVEVVVVNATLVPMVLPPLTCLALVPFVAAIVIALRMKPSSSGPPPDLDNPLELGSAIFFGLVLAVLSILVRATETWFGDTGVYILSAISGITDVDALSLSLAEATRQSLDLEVGAVGIFIGAAVNTVVKGVLATVIGGFSLAKWCASILLIALVLGAIAMGGVLWWSPVG